MSIYMILSRKDKFQIIGTMAVCSFFMNWAKVPLFVSTGIINAETLKLNVAAIPMVALGAFTGFFIAKKIPQDTFKNVLLALAFIAALNLIFR